MWAAGECEAAHDATPQAVTGLRTAFLGLIFWLLLSFAVACGSDNGDGAGRADDEPGGLDDGLPDGLRPSTSAYAPGLGAGLGRHSHALLAGAPTDRDQYPATGVILFLTRTQTGESAAIGSMVCSGTLIAPDVVLAAGHCQEPALTGAKGGVDFYFSLAADVSSYGPTLPALPPDAVRIASVATHPSYAAESARSGLSQVNDLALLYLDEPLAVAPAKLLDAASAARLLRPGSEVRVVGYGRHSLFLSAGDDGVKHWGRSTLEQVGAFELLLAASTNQAYKSYGDSGGPTFVVDEAGDEWLAGVTSRGAFNSSRGGIDTRIDPYLGWIAQRMQADCSTALRPCCMPL